MNNKIDFVILWVDGNDPKWLKEKRKYKKIYENDTSNDVNRFRDWELLKYWFRGAEKFAPWVNKIHFVTCGHVPDFLDINNPKINIVKHKDIIPKEYLPTFNSNVIQYYLHNIEGLTENFVMFDDDMFLLKNVKETDFFKNGKICDLYGEASFFYSKVGDKYPHCLLNNLQCINEHYNKRKFYLKNFFKVFNIKNGLKINIRTFFLSIGKQFTGIYSSHICQGYTKEYYELFWKYCSEELKEASKNRFRDYSDFSTFLIRYLQLVEGNFYPRSINFGKRIELSKDNTNIINAIKKQKYHVVCINDSDLSVDFDKTKEELKEAFETILSEKCSFEK